DLSVEIAQPMFANPSAGFLDYQRSQVEHGKCLGEQCRLPKGVINCQDGATAADRRARELPEDLRAQSSESAGHESVDRPERSVVLFPLGWLVCVDENVRIDQDFVHRPIRSSYNDSLVQGRRRDVLGCEADSDRMKARALRPAFASTSRRTGSVLISTRS